MFIFVQIVVIDIAWTGGKVPDHAAARITPGQIIGKCPAGWVDSVD